MISLIEHAHAARTPVSTAWLLTGAVAVGLLGWARPAPWLLAALLVVSLSVLWAAAVRGFLRVGAWGDEASSGG